MAKCASCGRDLGGFSFGKKLCRWCVDYEAGKRGERKDDEVQRVMPTPWNRSEALGGVTFNQLFLGVNVLVFLAMVASGISLMDGPSPQQMIHWGGNFGPLTLGGEPWRIVTYMFLHYGIIHIGFNMWCLWDLGALAESLYGDWTFAIVYLLCGLGGGVVSLAWHPATVSAGASGAIFGLAGALIASLKLGEFSLPRNMIAGSMRSVVIFAGYNLVFGAISGRTDNACHIGGLVTGLILGALIAVAAPDRHAIFQRLAICMAVLLLVGGAAAWVNRTHGFIVVEQRGEALLQQGKTDEAIVALQRAIRIQPNYVEAHYALAQAYAEKNQYAQEAAELKRVLELDPHDESAQYNLGLSYLNSDQLVDAQQAFSQMLAAHPNSGYAHLGLGVVAATEQKDEAAVDEFKKAIELDQQIDAYYSLGAAYVRLQRYDEAIPALKKHQEMTGDDYDTEIELAAAYRGKGMPNEAAQAMQQANTLNQKN